MTTQLLPKKRSGLWRIFFGWCFFARLDFEWIDYGSPIFAVFENAESNEVILDKKMLRPDWYRIVRSLWSLFFKNHSNGQLSDTTFGALIALPLLFFAGSQKYPNNSWLSGIFRFSFEYRTNDS